MCFVIENVLSEAEELIGIFKMERYNIGYSLSVANKCCDVELERSVKHSIYVLMDYEPYWSAFCGALYQSTKANGGN